MIRQNTFETKATCVTNDSPRNDTYQCYLNDITQIPMLTLEEEEKLGHAILFGDEEEKREAVSHLTAANLRLVVFISNRYKTNIPIMDLIQEGNLGLFHAANMFDYRKGKFSTYAGRWIRNNISMYLKKEGLLFIPPYIKKHLDMYHKAYDTLSGQGTEPTTKNISDFTGLSEARVCEILNYSYSLASLDADIHETDNGKMLDILEDSSSPNPEEYVEHEELKALVISILEKLPAKENFVIDALFGIRNGGIEQTLDNVGVIYESVFGKKISKEYVRQLRNRGLKRIMEDNQMSDALYEYYK